VTKDGSNARKKAARELAAAEQITYTEALRRIDQRAARTPPAGQESIAAAGAGRVTTRVSPPVAALTTDIVLIGHTGGVRSVAFHPDGRTLASSGDVTACLVPDTHPLGAGVLGRSGTPVASWLMNEADLLIVVGASFANHTGIAPYKPILQIDDNPAAIGRFDPVGAGIVGDATLTLEALLEELGATRTEDQRSAVAARWAIWRAEKARRAADERGRGVSAAAVFEALSRHLPPEAVVTVDVGNHAYSLGRYLESAGQPVLMSGYLGSIGFGYPAALGAWAAAPGRPVVAVTGDGGFGQYAAELTTAVKYGIPVKHVLLDNHSLGKISKEQLAADFPVWHTSLHNPDWAAYAELCGAAGIKADRRDQLDQAMTRLFAADGPALLHVSQDPELL
jgi:pyruvate oxidase